VVPGKIIGVQYSALRQGASEPPRQACLAARAVPVDRQDRWASRTREIRDPLGEVG